MVQFLLLVCLYMLLLSSFPTESYGLKQFYMASGLTSVREDRPDLPLNVPHVECRLLLAPPLSLPLEVERAPTLNSCHDVK